MVGARAEQKIDLETLESLLKNSTYFQEMTENISAIMRLEQMMTDSDMVIILHLHKIFLLIGFIGLLLCTFVLAGG